MVLCTISSFPGSDQLLASAALISFSSVFFSSLLSFSPPPISHIFSFPSFLPLTLPPQGSSSFHLRVPSVPPVSPHPAPSSRRPDGGGAPHAAGLPAPWRPGHQSLSIWPDASRRLSCPLRSSQVLGPRKPQAPESPGKLWAGGPTGNHRSPPVFPLVPPMALSELRPLPVGRGLNLNLPDPGLPPFRVPLWCMRVDVQPDGASLGANREDQRQA